MSAIKASSSAPFSGGIPPGLPEDDNPFDDAAEQIVLICGLHRLGTGAGVKLLEDEAYRALVNRQSKKEFHFPSGKEFGVAIYKVRVRGDNRAWCKAEGFEWCRSKVEEFVILDSWTGPYEKSPGSRRAKNAGPRE